MRRTMAGLMLLLLAGPAWSQDDKPKDKDKQATPAEQYKAILKDYNDAMSEFSKAYKEAKEPAERNKVFAEKYPKADDYAKRFMELAEKNPKDAIVPDCLTWVVTYNRGTAKDNPRDKALAWIQRDFVQSAKMAQVCATLRYSEDKLGEDLLRAFAEKNPDRAVQGQALLTLAQLLKRRADSLPRIRENPQYAKGLEARVGADRAKELLGLDPQAIAKESVQLFERVVAKFKDVKAGRGTLGDEAEKELFELNHLSVGKVAPDIEAEDLDGKKFKLSDYRGKVVMIDFWGHW